MCIALLYSMKKHNIALHMKKTSSSQINEDDDDVY
jgi:hypothetical protein